MFTTDNKATCRTCGQTKPVSEFYPLPYGGKGVRGSCKDCIRPMARETELRRKFGITVAEYEALAERQGHRCAVCGRTEAENESKSPRGTRRLGVDTDAVGRVRGLLCVHCRLIIGELESRPEIVAAASAYLDDFRASFVASGDAR